MAISIVIPAHNEEKRIRSVLSMYGDYFRKGEIIVVSDGADSTAAIVRELAQVLACSVLRRCSFLYSR